VSRNWLKLRSTNDSLTSQPGNYSLLNQEA
jgi:hypothetical protein